LFSSSGWRFLAGGAVPAAVMALACGDTAGVDPTQVASLTLIPALAEFDALGATVAMNATPRDAFGKELSGAELAWAVVDQSIATVDAEGVVTAVALGETEVTATSGSVSRTSAIVVTQVPAGFVIVSGDAQSALVTEALADPLVVEVTDRLGSAATGTNVNFEVTAGPGAVSVTDVAADASGRASTGLTLGTLAGEVYRVTASLPGSGTGTAVFTATGLPDVPTDVGLGSGDQQRQPAGAALPEELVVVVTDQYGNGTPGHQVDFVVTAGGGTPNPSSATTDAAGEARTVWTLGAVGAQSIEATSAGLTGSPVAFQATATNLAITQVNPDPMVEGQAAAIVGTGFDPAILDNQVTIGGLDATVTNASATTLDIVVPTGACRPGGSTDVVVTSVSGGTTPGFDAQFEPNPVVSLSVGQQTIIEDPAAFCLQFLAQGADEEYLIGVQSVSDVGNALTEVHLTGQTPGGVTPLMASAYRAPRTTVRLRPTAREVRWQLHRDAEVQMRVRERDILSALPRRSGGTRLSATLSSAAFIDSTVQVGQTVSLRMPNLATNICTESLSVSATVKAVGSRGIWLNDRDNPGNGFTDTDFQDLSDQFDNTIYDADVSYFGDPSDIDQNGRVIILVTEKINDLSNNTLGFVAPTDVLDRLTCPASNEAEIYYNRAPDPLGYTRADAIEDAPELIAHEFAHVIQAGRRLAINDYDFMDAFMAEGQATFAEEVVGHLETGRSAGQNYGYAVAFNDPKVDPVSWYRDQFTDVSFYFGRNDDPGSFDIPIPGAPARCSWVTSAPAPCQGRSLWYGVTWSFMRWIADTYGPSFGGGAQEIHRGFVDNDLVGFQNIEDVVGIPIETLLAKWAAALYLDDRGVAGLPADLTIPSWNFKDIFEDGALPGSAARETSPLSFGDFTTVVRVRSSSTAFFTIGGAGRPATALRVRDAADALLPSPMQIFVVRTK
jgi:hypothetical protein